MTSELKIKIISYSFALFSFLIFIYSFFFSDEEAYKSQAIYWFYGSLIVTLIPQISQLKYGDLELTLRKELKKAEENIEYNVEQNLSQGLGKVENSIQKSTEELNKSIQETEKRWKVFATAASWMDAQKVELVNFLEASDYSEVDDIESFRNDLLKYLDVLIENLRDMIFGLPSKRNPHLRMHLSNPDLYIRALRAIKSHTDELMERSQTLDSTGKSQLGAHIGGYIDALIEGISFEAKRA